MLTQQIVKEAQSVRRKHVFR